jgi:hypothetical protein
MQFPHCVLTNASSFIFGTQQFPASSTVLTSWVYTCVVAFSPADDYKHPMSAFDLELSENLILVINLQNTTVVRSWTGVDEWYVLWRSPLLSPGAV